MIDGFNSKSSEKDLAALDLLHVFAPIDGEGLPWESLRMESPAKSIRSES